MTIAFILFLNLVVPLFREELFPYSAFPMFSSVHDSYEEVEIIRPPEKNEEDIVIVNRYLGVPTNLPYGIRPPQGLVSFGETVTDKALESMTANGARFVVRRFAQKKNGSYGQVLKREVPEK